MKAPLRSPPNPAAEITLSFKFLGFKQCKALARKLF
jgi:hypothetical protein